jgi:hypothetical protein
MFWVDDERRRRDGGQLKLRAAESMEHPLDQHALDLGVELVILGVDGGVGL